MSRARAGAEHAVLLFLAAARLAATSAEADAINAGIFPQLWTAAAAAAPGAAAPVVIDVDTHYSPLTPPAAAAAAQRP